MAPAKAASLRLRGADAEAPTVAVSFPIGVLDALIAAGHAKSKGEGRRLISQGGVKLGEARVDQQVAADAGHLLDLDDAGFQQSSLHGWISL
jgi:tyrosyl-tRNA synthetase